MVKPHTMYYRKKTKGIPRPLMLKMVKFSESLTVVLAGGEKKIHKYINMQQTDLRMDTSGES